MSMSILPRGLPAAGSSAPSHTGKSQLHCRMWSRKVSISRTSGISTSILTAVLPIHVPQGHQHATVHSSTTRQQSRFLANTRCYVLPRRRPRTQSASPDDTWTLTNHTPRLPFHTSHSKRQPTFTLTLSCRQQLDDWRVCHGRTRFLLLPM